MKFDLISIGTVAVDLFFKGDSLTHSHDRFEFAVGGKYFAEKFYETLGGGGANVAIGVSKQNLRVALMAKIGKNPFKKLILDTLEETKVSYREYCQMEEEYYNISSIFLTEKGEKTVINYRTPHQHFMTHEEDYKILTHAKAVYLANLPNVALTERGKMLHFAQKNKVMTIANLGVSDCRRPKSQLEEFLPKVDVLIINDYEFADLVKAPHKDIDFSEDIVSHYIPYLKEHLVVVTQGEHGSNAYQNGKVYFQKALPVEKVVDTTGAGDGYTAGFIAEYLKSSDIEKAMHAGAKYAVRILGRIGAN